MKKLLGVIALILAASRADAQSQTVIKARDTVDSSKVLDVGDDANKAIRVRCIIGCSGGSGGGTVDQGTGGLSPWLVSFDGAQPVSQSGTWSFTLDNPFPAALDADGGLKVHIQNATSSTVTQGTSPWVVAEGDATATAALSSTTCPGTGCVELSAAGKATIAGEIDGSACDGTWVIEQLIGSTWLQTAVSNVSDPSSPVNGNSCGGIDNLAFSVGGRDRVRIRMTAFTSGALNVLLRSSAKTIASEGVYVLGTTHVVLDSDVNIAGGVVQIAGTSNSILADSTSTPAGTENGLIVRNIPSGTQTVDGAVTATVTDGSGPLTVDGTVNVNNISGTISLPTGAATESTLNARLAALNILPGATNAPNRTGAPVLAAVYSTIPSLTNDQSAPFTLSTNGGMRIDGSQFHDSSATALLPVFIGGFASAAAPTAVSDQDLVHAWMTRAGATVAQPVFGTTLASTGNGTTDGGTQRFTLSSDSTGQVVLAAGSAAIGKLAANAGVNIGDIGTVTAVTAITNALPAGTNAIGKLAANAGVNIGDIGNLATIGTSIVPGTSATHLGKAEDAGATTGDTGVANLLVRRDSAAVLTSAADEYVNPAADAYGMTYSRVDHVNRVRCTISSTATTSTIVTGCSAPGSGLSIYITGISWSSSIISTTANFMLLQSGTGGTCGVATTAVYNGFAPTAFATVTWSPETPLKLTANHELCFVHASAGTRFVNISGFIAQ